MGIVLEATNPYGNLAAVVEDDGRAVTLYVHPVDERSIPARSLKLVDRDPATSPTPGSFRAVWTPEGDGVVVLDGTKPIGLLPSGNVAGIALSDGSREMAEATRLVAESDAYYARFAVAEGQSPFVTLRDAEIARLEAKFGTHVAYYSADENRFPPLAVVEFAPENFAGGRLYVSVGMRLRPLPAAFARTPRHVEIAVATSGESGWGPNVVAWLARYPWRVYTSVGDGVLVASPAAEASWFVPDRSAMFLLASPPASVVAGAPMPAPELAGASGGTDGTPSTTFLWALPVTMLDMRTARLAGAARLTEILAARGEGWRYDDEG
ncbi:MAG: suppressor of fused domain protein [Polyangiaceae bacterium]